MQFNLEVHLKIEGTGISCGGTFAARNKSEIPMVAYEYIKSIKRQTGYRTTLIEKVIINRTEDITENVNEIQNRPIQPMEDIFW